MLELSIALIIIACIAGFLVNKFIDKKYPVNTVSAIDADTIAALDERINKFDQRLDNVDLLKQEFEALKLTIGLRNGR